MENITTIKNFDNLEMLSVTNQSSGFPEHFHETFCITLIRTGVEATHLQNSILYCPAGSISITNPYEVHANPLLDKDSNTSFDTIYLSQDVVDFYLGRKKVFFQKKQFRQPQIVSSFLQLQSSLPNQDCEIETSILNLLQLLENDSYQQHPKPSVFSPSIWPEIIHYIEQNLTNKMTLEILASFSNTDKFNFAKKFRAKFGISPMNYILMKKIFAAKKLINKEINLTALAYEFDFSDQAHFSKTFKRFIGISPNQFKKNL